MKRITAFTTLFLAVTLLAMAQHGSPRDIINANPGLSATNHAIYPYPQHPLPQLTPTPDGYEPFYLNHYGRHGSRWFTNAVGYTRPLEVLSKADAHRALTPRGQRLLGQVATIARAAEGRAGELSDIGAEQHQGIAQRMYQNFPEIFAGDAHIDARSTIFIRCILSMLNETGALKACNPQLRVTADASKHDMHYTGWGYGEDTLANPLRKRMDAICDKNKVTSVDPSHFMGLIFSDQAYARDSVNAHQFMTDMFALAGIVQNHHALDYIDLWDLFTQDEIFEYWRINNIYWYIHWANAPQNGNRMPYIERALLRNMVQSADSVIRCGGRGAALRFGHETCVIPLAALMEVDNANYSCDDLDDLHNHWQSYNIYPMACNIQMVFYRKTGSNGATADDVLVKVLFNEREATLPVKADKFPYYRWSDLRSYYLNKLATPINWSH